MFNLFMRGLATEMWCCEMRTKPVNMVVSNLILAQSIMAESPGFLKTVLAHLSNPDHPSNRPYVTLTFAQSLDAKIAGANRKQLILSGKESMVMTHWYVSKPPHEYLSLSNFKS